MRLLLDTHALIWALEGGRRLSPTARAAIADASNVVLASVVSAWEIVIKTAIGRLRVPDDLDLAIDEAGFVRRLVEFSDVVRLRELPLEHRDPFDRMLVAQALADGVPLVTKDPWVARYPVQVLW